MSLSISRRCPPFSGSALLVASSWKIRAPNTNRARVCVPCPVPPGMDTLSGAAQSCSWKLPRREGRGWDPGRLGALPAAPSPPRFSHRPRLGKSPLGLPLGAGERGGWQSHRATGGRIAPVAPAQRARLRKGRLGCTCPGARGGGGRGRSGRGLQVLPAGAGGRPRAGAGGSARRRRC